MSSRDSFSLTLTSCGGSSSCNCPPDENGKKDEVSLKKILTKIIYLTMCLIKMEACLMKYL